MKKQEVYELDYWELQELIKEEFGYEYDFVAAEELSNDSTWSVTITGELDPFEKAEVDKFAETGVWPDYGTHMIFDEMCRRGTLNPGRYIVEVLW